MEDSPVTSSIENLPESPDSARPRESPAPPRELGLIAGRIAGRSDRRPSDRAP
jgi:hypothetical protein